jgi:hypothetical protein
MTVRAWLILALAGCGSSDPTSDAGEQGGGPASDALLQAVCQAECDFFVRCGEVAASDGATCVSRCVTGSGNPSAYRADALQLTATCYQNAQECVDPEACIDQSIAALNPQWQQDTVYQACAAKAAECDTSEDNCTSAIVTTNTTRAALSACFAGTCEALPACCQAAIGRPAS